MGACDIGRVPPVNDWLFDEVCGPITLTSGQAGGGGGARESGAELTETSTL